jgi:hypothetical protein
MNWRSADSANAFHRILDIFRIKNWLYLTYNYINEKEIK